ncbi:neuropeptide CCHamide-1 receptor-like isoform X2 [Panonychus citri]|nr:neuropeptide CCHamide-1 receptor-like isoform X2 [Panonychus citri]
MEIVSSDGDLVNPDNNSNDDTDNLTVYSSNDKTKSPYVPYDQRIETYMVPIICAFIFLIGSISNGLTITIIIRERLYLTPSYLFIFNLSLGDLIVILGTVPFVATIYTFESWPYGEIVCRLSEFIRDVSVSVTVFTLTVMSYDRYKATFAIEPRPIVSGGRNQRTPFHVKLLNLRYGKIVAGIWILSCLIGLPAAINTFILEVIVDPEKTIKVCYPFPAQLGPLYPKIVIWSKFFLLYLIPLIVICFCYTLISLELRRYSSLANSRRNVDSNGTTSSALMSGFILTSSGKHRFRRRIVIIFVVAFVICFFPNHVFLLWYYHSSRENHYTKFWHIWRIVGFILSFANSCLNPLILYLTSQRFRSKTKNFLSLCLNKHNDDNHQHHLHDPQDQHHHHHHHKYHQNHDLNQS